MPFMISARIQGLNISTVPIWCS